MFQRDDGVHGVTTAAGLWVAAAIGVIIGFGLYPLAIFATAVTVLIFFGLWYVEHRFIDWYNGK
jgi:putative Mg2+ transporter-C (MgtC) family protein